MESKEKDISPELRAKIDKVRKEYDEGKTVTVSSHEELDALFDSL